MFLYLVFFSNQKKVEMLKYLSNFVMGLMYISGGFLLYNLG